MDRETLLRRVAPCGLVCYTCAAAKDGVIQRHGRELIKHLDGFEPYAEMMSAHDERLEQYPLFRGVLQMIGDAGCEGCRDGVCKFPGCGIAPCAAEKGHDFCFECPEFPCGEADFEPLLKAKWLRANERMEQVGAEAYLDEMKDRSHYE